MDPLQQLALYRAMASARHLEQVEQELVARGEAFFHVSSAGHEASREARGQESRSGPLPHADEVTMRARAFRGPCLAAAEACVLFAQAASRSGRRGEITACVFGTSSGAGFMAARSCT